MSRARLGDKKGVGSSVWHAFAGSTRSEVSTRFRNAPVEVSPELSKDLRSNGSPIGAAQINERTRKDALAPEAEGATSKRDFTLPVLLYARRLDASATIERLWKAVRDSLSLLRAGCSMILRPEYFGHAGR